MITPPQHILIVEDEEHLAIGIKYNLEAEGYKVTVHVDALSASRQIQERPANVDLVILDLMLPGMSGYTLCQKLRESSFDKPILILSARALPEDRTRGFDLGANQYMTKPFELDELLSRVKNLLTLYRPRTENVPARVATYEFGESKVNFDTFEATVGDKPVRLTTLQLKLLQYFVAHEGRVIPRQELLEKVWEMPGHMQTRAPDQFMSQLRKAFEPDPAKPVHFLTVRDAGYRFIAKPKA